LPWMRRRCIVPVMIDVHYWPTPNGWKVTIMLEECGMPYEVIPVDIGAGEQFKPDFLRLSPNNRMPAIVDHEPVGGGDPITIFESGAILEYLADKSGKFLPKEPRARFRVLQWVYWQMANLGPMMGNANHFKNYAKSLTDDPKQLEYGTKRFVGEVERLCGVMDAQLSVQRYLAGPDYTIADIISWPWAMLLGRLIDESLWEKFSHLKRWVDELQARPAVDRGFNVGKELRDRTRTPEEEERFRKILFNQTADSVRRAREAAAKASA
jgi:GSH-dependent disulfide-bond oxidoreductase